MIFCCHYFLQGILYNRIIFVYLCGLFHNHSTNKQCPIRLFDKLKRSVYSYTGWILMSWYYIVLYSTKLCISKCCQPLFLTYIPFFHTHTHTHFTRHFGSFLYLCCCFSAFSLLLSLTSLHIAIVEEVIEETVDA